MTRVWGVPRERRDVACALSVLVMAWRRSVSNGDRLRVSRGRDNVAHMFHLTALDTVLPFIPA